MFIFEEKFKINTSNILGHSDISPQRKQDPGEKFPGKTKSKNWIWYKFLKNKVKKY